MIVMAKLALPALGIFAGGLVHSLLPVGHFGTYDRLVQATIFGTVAGATAALIFSLTD
jgi:hypothetical protein